MMDREQCTQVEEFVQQLSADRHVSVPAELHPIGSQDIVDLLTDDLQSLRVTHQVVHGPEGGRDRVPQRRPEDGKVMSWKSGGGESVRLLRGRSKHTHTSPTPPPNLFQTSPCVYLRLWSRGRTEVQRSVGEKRESTELWSISQQNKL